MTDPQRLLEQPGDYFERALLRSSRIDEPLPGAATRAAAALGVGSAIVSGASTASGIGAGGAAAAASKLGGLALAKWVGVGIFAGGVAVAGYELTRPVADATPVLASKQSEVSRTVPAGEPGEKMTSVSASEPVVPASQPLPERGRSPSPLPRVPAKSGTPAALPQPSQASLRFEDAPSVPTQAAPRPAVSSIAGEVSALDRARAALGARRPADALRALDEYERSAGSRVLGQEASMLRVEALLQAGDRAAAAALAQRLLAAEPLSPHAPRWRAVAEQNP